MRLSPTSRRPQTSPADGPHAGRLPQAAAPSPALRRPGSFHRRRDTWRPVAMPRRLRRPERPVATHLPTSSRLAEVAGGGSDSLRLGVYPLIAQSLDPPFSPAHEARALVRNAGRMWYSSPGMKWGPLPSCGKHPDLQEPAPQKTMRLEGRRMRRFGGPLTIVQRRCSDGRKTCPLRAGVPSPALVGRWIGAVPRCRRTRGHHRR